MWSVDWDAVYAFIDDSGDPGFKLTEGSTVSLVIACLIFENSQHVEDAANAVREFRRSLGRRDMHEFKFNRANHQERVDLCRLAARQNMFIRAIRIQKDRLYSQQLRGVKGSLYQYAIRQVLSKASGVASSLRVTLDGSGDRLYRREMSTYLRRKCNQEFDGLIDRVKLVDSKKDQVVQLADAVAGAVRLRYDGGRPNSREPFNALRPLTMDRRSSIWDFR